MGMAAALSFHAHSSAFGTQSELPRNCTNFFPVCPKYGRPNASLKRLMGSLHRGKTVHSCCEQPYVCRATQRIKWRHRAAKDGFDDGHEVEAVSKLDIDRWLAIAEVICIVQSAVFSIGYAVRLIIQNSTNVTLSTTTSPLNKYINGWLTWQIFPLLGGLIIGAIIRRRQWQRITRSPKDSEKSGDGDISLVERIRKLEEDVGSSVTIIRVLSRQLEKLGIRFRVTRRTLRDPINETAVLVQKTSEAVRLLTIQEDRLENELREIQHILLAMQEQQRKQLELILALGKAGTLQKRVHRSVESNKKPEASQEYSKTKVSSLSSAEANPSTSILTSGIGIIQKVGSLRKSFTQKSDGNPVVHSGSCKSSKEKEHLPGASRSQLSGCFGNSESPQVNSNSSGHVNDADNQILSAGSDSGQDFSRVPAVQDAVQNVSSKPDFLNSYTTSQDFSTSNSQERADDSRNY